MFRECFGSSGNIIPPYVVGGCFEARCFEESQKLDELETFTKSAPAPDCETLASTCPSQPRWRVRSGDGTRSLPPITGDGKGDGCTGTSHTHRPGPSWGVPSTGRARPSHITRHKIFWNTNNNMKDLQ
jgi:hypothetical protein